MVVNTNEERVKDEILADLYALRAGLGVIFDELQVIDKIGRLPNLITNVLPASEQRAKMNLERKEKEYQQTICEINNEKVNLSKLKNKLKEISCSTDKIEAGKLEENAQAEAKRKNRALHFWSKATGIIGSLIVLFFLGIYWWLTSSVEDEEVAVGPFISILFTIGLPLIILSFCLKKKYKSAIQYYTTRVLYDLKASYENETRNLARAIAEYQQNISYLEKRANIEQEDCRKAKEWHEEEIQELSLRKKDLEKFEGEGGISAHRQKIQCIETALHNVYDCLLDERDWENVDLIIYYFETGRVDTLKEALWHVDRQRQADEIAEAIYMASSAISGSIERSMKRLGEGLSKSFSVISAQISEVAKQQSANLKMAEKAMQSNEQAIKTLESKLAQQLEGIDLSNALLKNIENDSREIIMEWENMKYKYSL